MNEEIKKLIRKGVLYRVNPSEKGDTIYRSKFTSNIIIHQRTTMEDILNAVYDHAHAVGYYVGVGQGEKRKINEIKNVLNIE